MGKTIRKNNRYSYGSDDCAVCKHFAGKKRGCKLKKCCYEDEKLDLIQHRGISRERGLKE